MKLTDLEAVFWRIEKPLPGAELGHRREVDHIGQADGIFFLCPKCFAANGGPVGTHGIVCWRPHVPLSEPPKPGRWEFVGTGLADLTLQASSSSIQLQDGCNAHFHVKNGGIEMCP